MCAPDDGWGYHPKHVEQFPDINKLCNLHLVGYILEYKKKLNFCEDWKTHNLHKCLISVLGAVKYEGFQEK